MLDFFVSRYGYDALDLDMETGYLMMVKGYRQSQEDKIYNKWLFYHFVCSGEKNLTEFTRMHFGQDEYRKSTKEEKENILKKYGGK